MDRSFKRLNNENWEDIQFEDLKKGDRFIAFEPNGDPVEEGRIYTALSDAKGDGITISKKEIANGAPISWPNAKG